MPTSLGYNLTNMVASKQTTKKGRDATEQDTKRHQRCKDAHTKSETKSMWGKV